MTHTYASIYTEEQIEELESIIAEMDERIAHAKLVLAQPDKLKELSIKAGADSDHLQKRWEEVLAQSRSQRDLAAALLD